MQKCTSVYKSTWNQEDTDFTSLNIQESLAKIPDLTNG